MPVRPPPACPRIARRPFLLSLLALLAPGTASAAAAEIGFNELYGKVGVLGLEFSQKVLELDGQRVRIVGFMAPPLKAEASFFVLGKAPMAICPFCSSDADWPDDIVVIYLKGKQTFERTTGMIAVEGVLEHGSWTDPETGFVSLLRVRDAEFETA
ncbi:MAG TPA: hypothetical protein PKD62_11830 [Amaricoccus sp.]|nr:hypothetical protein [Amaricoccus sp.]